MGEQVPVSPPDLKEIPRRKFEVKMFLPDRLYSQVTDDLHSRPKSSWVDMNDTLINDKFLTTTDAVLNYSGTKTDASYRVSSNLWLSPPVQMEPDKGYYDDERLSNIALSLNNQGLKAQVDKRLTEREQVRNIVVIDSYDIKAEVDLGVAIENPAKVKQPNKKIAINLIAVQGTVPKLSSSDEFSEALGNYARVFETVVNTLYQDRMITAPQQAIILNDEFYDPATIQPQAQQKRVITENDLISPFVNREDPLAQEEEVIKETIKAQINAISQVFGQLPELDEEEFPEYSVVRFDPLEGILVLDRIDETITYVKDTEDGLLIRRELINSDDVDGDGEYGDDTISIQSEKGVIEYTLKRYPAFQENKRLLNLQFSPPGGAKKLEFKYDQSQKNIVKGSFVLDPPGPGRWQSKQSVGMEMDTHDQTVAFFIDYHPISINMARKFGPQEIGPHEFTVSHEGYNIVIHVAGDSMIGKLSIPSPEKFDWDEFIARMNGAPNQLKKFCWDPLLDITETTQVDEATPYSNPNSQNRRESLYANIEDKIAFVRKIWSTVERMDIVRPTDSAQVIADEEKIFADLQQELHNIYPHEAFWYRNYMKLQGKKRKTSHERQQLKVFESNLNASPNSTFMVAIDQGLPGLLDKRRKVRATLLRLGEGWKDVEAYNNDLPKEFEVYKGYILGIVPGRFSITARVEVDGDDPITIENMGSVQAAHISGSVWNITPHVSQILNGLEGVVDKKPEAFDDLTREFLEHEEAHAITEEFYAGGLANIRDWEMKVNQLEKAAGIFQGAKEEEKDQGIKMYRVLVKGLLDEYGCELDAEIISKRERNTSIRTFAGVTYRIVDRLQSMIGVNAQTDKILKRAINDFQTFHFDIDRLYRKIDQFAPERRRDLDIAFMLFTPSEVRHVEKLVDRWTKN